MPEHPMSVEEAIRTRRTHKAYRPEPLERELLDELLDLARWAPNHHLSNPWRFRVLGPRSLERLKAAAETLQAGSGAKLERAPTLIAASVLLSGEATPDKEDLLAGAVAAYIVLLAAHARGLAGYWRTPAVLESPAGRSALGLAPEETVLGLLYLGRPREPQRVPERAPLQQIAHYLD